MDSSDMKKLTSRNAIDLLESVAGDGSFSVFELPSGRKIIVTADDGFETFRLALRDPQFIDMFERGMQDLKEGKVLPFDNDHQGEEENET